MSWENVGFIRNEEAECQLFWECTECGFTVAGDIQPPEFECPNCKINKQHAETKE